MAPKKPQSPGFDADYFADRAQARKKLEETLAGPRVPNAAQTGPGTKNPDGEAELPAPMPRGSETKE